MKSLLAALLLFLSVATVQAQVPGAGYAALPKDSASQKVVYTDVVQVPGASKEVLFARAQEWAGRSFVDSKAAGRVIDKEAGTVLYRATISNAETVYSFLVALYVKEGRYKYLLNDFTDKPYLPAGSLQTPVERWAKYAGRGWAIKRADELNKQVALLLTSLNNAMKADSPQKGW